MTIAFLLGWHLLSVMPPIKPLVTYYSCILCCFYFNAKVVKLYLSFSYSGSIVLLVFLIEPARGADRSRIFKVSVVLYNTRK